MSAPLTEQPVPPSESAEYAALFSEAAADVPPQRESPAFFPEETPAAGEIPAADDLPAWDESPAAEDIPAADRVPVMHDIPAADEIPAWEEPLPAAEPVPLYDDGSPEEPESKTSHFPAPKKRSRKWMIIPAALLAAAGIVCAALFLSGKIGPALPQGTTAAGMNIGGLTQGQAVQLVKETVARRLGSHSVTLQFGTGHVTLGSGVLGLQVDAKGLVKAAAAGNDTGLAPWLRPNESSLRNALTQVDQALNQIRTNTACNVIYPSRDASSEGSDEAGPVLSIFLGAESAHLDIDGMYQKILTSLGAWETTIVGDDLVSFQGGSLPDADALYEANVVSAQDASIDPNTKEVTPEVCGLEMDREVLRDMLRNAKAGDTIQVPMVAIQPEITSSNVYFRDVLGYAISPHTDHANRNVNLSLACAAINGVVLQPGETLSYNDTVGDRTEQAGFLPAPAYSLTNLVDSIGGGVCQVSSTLYLCSLFAEMDIVERVNHGYPVNYLPLGLDATVSMNGPDLKIRNPYSTPIQILAEVSEGFVRVWIRGVETRNYSVRMAFGSGGNYASSRVRRYTSDGRKIYESDRTYSGYLNELTSVVGEIGSGQYYQWTNVKNQDIWDPRPETLEAAKTLKAANRR